MWKLTVGKESTQGGSDGCRGPGCWEDFRGNVGEGVI